MRRVTLIFLILLLLLSSNLNSGKVISADRIEDLESRIEEKKKDQERIKSAINEVNALIESMKKRKATEFDELNRIENETSRVAKELDKLAGEEETLKTSYNETNAELEKLSESIKKEEEHLNKILFTLYRNYTLNYSAYIFSSESFNEIMDKSMYLQFLISADKNYVSSLKESKEKQASLLKEQVDKQVRLSVVLDEKRKKMEELSSFEKEKENEISKIIFKLEKSAKEREALIEAHDRTEREIKELIREKEEEIRRRKFKQNPMGPLIWPVNGPVSSGFGMRLHPIFGVYRMHTGIDIDAPYGTPIKAVQDGYVIFAGWLGGYGNTVIIQHDEKYSTLYGHMRSYNVSEEQFVKQGFVIGSVGSTGWATGPHLHFEIRINGEPTNPLNFLP
jgi:murein DD-endopeptidase MepM/ murein hydrolase activator NlpD